mgnify:CR=1 FL=1
MLTEFLNYCTEDYAPSQVLDTELAICSVLHMEFAIPSNLDFLYCSLQRLRWPSMFAVHRGQHDQVSRIPRHRTRYL